MKRTTPLKRTAFKPKDRSWKLTNGTRSREKAPRKNAMKTRQRAVTVEEKRLWDRMASEIGCIACRVAGRATSDYVSIHHIDGRTKKNCHQLVLPLCAGCHQQGTGTDKSLVAVHPNKTRFEQLYGTQLELLARVHTILGIAS
jgi:hypothetical protein